MKRRIAVFLTFVLIVSYASALSFYGSRYTMSSEMKSDADLVHLYFSSASGSAADAYERMWQSMYVDAEEYVLNKNKFKIHKPSCSGVKQMNEDNKIYVYCSKQFLLDLGYSEYGNCHP